MSYKILTLNDSKEWSDLLAKLPEDQQDIYYTPEYYSLYENYGDGKAMCFVFEKDGGIALYPFLINSVNALGYNLDKEYYDIQGAYGYNGVVSSSYEPSFIKEFYSEFNSFCADNNIIAEFTRFNPLMNNYIFSKNNYIILFDRKTVYVDLSYNIDDIKSDFSSSTKRAIKKAQKNNLYLKVFENNSSLREIFITLYKETMNRVGSDSYLYFNKKYFDRLFAINNVVQFLVEFESKPIASSICFYSKNYFHYHLGASNKEHLNNRPNDLLFEEMIKFGKYKNCKYLHFGGGTSSEEGDSLLKFKKGFSKSYLDFYIGKRMLNQNIYDEVVKQWELKYPDKTEKYKNFLLKYRY